VRNAAGNNVILIMKRPSGDFIPRPYTRALQESKEFLKLNYGVVSVAINILQDVVVVVKTSLMLHE